MADKHNEEKEMLESLEKGEWHSRKPTKAEMARYKASARATFIKDRRVNIRISSKDLDGVQKKALEEGIPYQTLISSVIHKYVSGRLVDKP
jgi:predicted DNA binding CopG/RHH family protein